jgi:hypothetical protein
MLSSLGAAVYDGINAQYSYLQSVNEVWLEYMNASAKTSACNNFMKAVPQNLYWCKNNVDCTSYMTKFWSNTALEYETFVAFLQTLNPFNESTRLLAEADHRVLA